MHKKTGVAAVIVPERCQGGHRETRTFGTSAGARLALSDGLLAPGVTHVAMQSTGEYGKPVFNLLEPAFEALRVNACQSGPGAQDRDQRCASPSS